MAYQKVGDSYLERCLTVLLEELNKCAQESARVFKQQMNDAATLARMTHGDTTDRKSNQ
jgi:hypothetical protein